MALTKQQRLKIKRGQKGLCAYCKKVDIMSRGQLHHRDSNPKNNSLGNLVFLCKGCHQKVTSRKPRYPGAVKLV